MTPKFNDLDMDDGRERSLPFLLTFRHACRIMFSDIYVGNGRAYE